MQMVTHNCMYNVDWRSEEFINGAHYFLSVAEINKRDGFMCCHLTEYSNSRTLHSLLLKSGFVPNYICWTKHGENGIIMDEGEEEEEYNNWTTPTLLLSTVASMMLQWGDIMKKR